MFQFGWANHHGHSSFHHCTVALVGAFGVMADPVELPFGDHIEKKVRQVCRAAVDAGVEAVDCGKSKNHLAMGLMLGRAMARNCSHCYCYCDHSELGSWTSCQ